ncbi:putative glycosyltransferase, DXD sugar-binding, alpha 1,4-glycosyltransferase [Helianthus anomalus]
MNNTRPIFALISLIFLFLLSFNGASLRIPSLSPPQKLAGDPFYSPESRFYNPHLRKSPTSENSPEKLAGDPFYSPESPFYNPILRKSLSYHIESENSPENRNKKLLKMLSGFGSSRRDDFPARVNEFFHKKNETSSCKIRFFMTWISSSNSFNKRSIQSIESVFKSHPKACLLIISNSLDSIKGRQILQPFVEKRFRVTSIAPDFSYLFKNTMAESWFSKLIRGQVQAGNVPLGQNLSNLVRLCLLYKYGGVYIDADVIVLNRFDKVKNAIGAQTIDPNSKKWTRLNNAVMVFDKMHPLVYKFIEEFALTFNGNKWGHNGPFMVSRVVSRLQGRPGYKFTVLPPPAFYPVSWVNVRALFRGPKNETDLRWSTGVFEQIRNHSYTLHLWNKQSRGFRVEQGSVVSKIFLDTCVFCNASRTNSTI